MSRPDPPEVVILLVLGLLMLMILTAPWWSGWVGANG